MILFEVGKLYKKKTKWQEYQVEDPDDPRIIVIESVNQNKYREDITIDFYFIDEPDSLRVCHLNDIEDRWEPL